jgi:hypothetical protein
MKIKKSELLALIKEEIMDEMRGVTMMPDPNDDDAVPAGMEPGGAMQQVGKEIDRLITIEMDDEISMISNYLVTAGIGSDPVKLAYKGMGMLRDAGFTPPDMAALEKMTAAQDYDDDDDYDDDYDFSEFEADMMMENITDPVVQQTLIDVAAKLAPLAAGVGLPPLIMALVGEIKNARKKKKRGEM